MSCVSGSIKVIRVTKQEVLVCARSLEEYLGSFEVGEVLRQQKFLSSGGCGSNATKAQEIMSQ